MKASPITKTIVTKKQYDSVSKTVLPELKKVLPSHLTYHNYKHVRYVIKATAYLLEKEAVPEKDKWLLLTAALLHDAGFLRAYKNHEEESSDIASEILPDYGYSDESIEAIRRMIMATKIPQTPVDHYGEILCDADLFYLGTDDFIPIADNLFKELKAIGAVKTEQEWDEKQLGFLHQHRYFTKTAIAELEPKKRANVKKLEEKWK
jgi:predicted metal-dependent HD superfamily phosphohydrolase